MAPVDPVRPNSQPAPNSGQAGAEGVRAAYDRNKGGGGKDKGKEKEPEPAEVDPEAEDDAHLEADSFARRRGGGDLNALFSEKMPWEIEEEERIRRVEALRKGRGMAKPPGARPATGPLGTGPLAPRPLGARKPGAMPGPIAKSSGATGPLPPAPLTANGRQVEGGYDATAAVNSTLAAHQSLKEKQEERERERLAQLAKRDAPPQGARPAPILHTGPLLGRSVTSMPAEAPRSQPSAPPAEQPAVEPAVQPIIPVAEVRAEAPKPVRADNGAAGNAPSWLKPDSPRAQPGPEATQLPLKGLRTPGDAPAARSPREPQSARPTPPVVGKSVPGPIQPKHTPATASATPAPELMPAPPVVPPELRPEVVAQTPRPPASPAVVTPPPVPPALERVVPVAPSDAEDLRPAVKAGAGQAGCMCRVIDAATGVPMKGSRIEVEPTKDDMLPVFNGQADFQGWWGQSNVPPGEYRVTVRHAGYVPQFKVHQLVAGEVADIAIFLAKP